MALPALRQPKLVSAPRENFKKVDTNYVILTLKNESKLVVAADAYHGIIAEEEMYKCVFCAASIHLDRKCLELHKGSAKHRAAMTHVPYIESFSDHLMRQLEGNETYCTICNVVLASYSVARHTINEAHSLEFDKAYARGLEYKPYS